MTPRLAPGIHLDIASADYFADPCSGPSLTQSIASVLLDKSPRHAALRHPRLNPAWEPYEDTKFNIGNAAHRMLIGRGKELVVCNYDDWRTKDAKAERDAAHAGGNVAILAHQFSTARDMACSFVDQVSTIDDCKGAFNPDIGGSGETVIIAEYEGVILRSMVDWMRDTTHLDDLKTTGKSASPDNLPYVMADGGWDLQAAIQERILDVLDPDGRGRRHHYFYLQEDDDPYEVTVCELPESVMTIGRAKLDRAISIWRTCIQSNRWPGYARVVHQPAYPAYMEARVLERLMGGEDERDGR